ncbi:MAG: glycoside hydrolase family 2 [Pseudobacter sp.]|uniref:glycoside hydrolase family 2 n=1 Tax=Pseudobacter sp. TaxID=2045420 RepID=UPI003F80E3DC
MQGFSFMENDRGSVKRAFKFLAAGMALLSSVLSQSSYAQQILLNGMWKVQLEDSLHPVYTIKLPGTLDDAGIGKKNMEKPLLNIASLGHLARKVSYTGKAHYSRTIRIPSGWKNKNIILSLGRVIWRSEISIDGVKIPVSQQSLVTEHVYDLTGRLQPGRQHQLTITIDNSDLFPEINATSKRYASEDSYEMAHAYTNHTQIKWNGILGYISLKAKPALSLIHADITPEWKEKQLRIRFSINNPSGKPYTVKSYVIDPVTKKKWTVSTNNEQDKGESFEAGLPMDPTAKRWNEFSPKLYQLITILQSADGSDTLRTAFGLRDLTVQHNDLYLNDQRIFIRGNLECVIFPLTGYPPMKKQEWLDLYKKAKDFGLNSFRFHSWCPPGVAFEAADEIGFYLQVELPHWSLTVAKDPATFSFLKDEAARILGQYGNHPSFLFFSMGNELEGNFDQLNALVHELKERDGRRLYTTTSFSFQQGVTGIPQREDDFFITQWTKDGWVRGQGVFNDQSPDFSKDYTATSAIIKMPVISHEIGQYSVYPDLSEIAKYTGNLVPHNFIAIKNDLAEKGLLHKAPEFLYASGKLATLLYKEEIERAMKTRGFDGFQLLQLQDFPGQGTALVGLLNAFWQPKGFVSAAAFKAFNNALTPLIRYPKAVYLNNETFTAEAELANFFQPLKQAAVEWNIRNDKGVLLAKGVFEKRDYPVGNGLKAGTMQFPLQEISTAARLQVELRVNGTAFHNSWNIWIYPADLRSTADHVLVTGSYEEAKAALDKGKTVLLSPPVDTIKGITGRFVPVFWSPVHFPDQPGTMGLLIKSKHAALRNFPTDTYTDWQWWDLTKKSKTLKLDSIPDKAVIVRVIDNFVTNGNLANLFEVKVGKGRLIFSGMDLMTDLDNRPQAKQLRYSLLEYMKSPAFGPSVTVTTEWIKQLLK